VISIWCRCTKPIQQRHLVLSPTCAHAAVYAPAGKWENETRSNQIYKLCANAATFFQMRNAVVEASSGPAVPCGQLPPAVPSCQLSAAGAAGCPPGRPVDQSDPAQPVENNLLGQAGNRTLLRKPSLGLKIIGT